MALSAQPWSWRTGLQDAITVAAVCGVTETAAAFVTGRFPAIEAASIPAVTIAASLALGLPLSWAADRLGLRDLGTLQLGSLMPLLGLVVLHSGGTWPMSGLALIVALLWLRPGRRPAGLTPAGLGALAFATFAFATIVCVATRARWSIEGRAQDWQIAAPALLLGGIIARRRSGSTNRGVATALVLAGAMAACGMIGAGLANRPPSLPRSFPAASPPRGSKSVLFIVMDAVRRDHTSVYGYGRPTTPALETLSRRSVVFARANASASYSLPSHASLFSGRRPSEHGAHPSVGPEALGLRPEVDTLPEALAAKGYNVAGLSANPVIFSSVTGMRRVFPSVVASPRRACGHVPLSVSILSRLQGPTNPSPCQQTWAAADMTNAALTWLGEQGSRPFFLFVNYFDAHWPYLSPAEFRARLSPSPEAAGPEGRYDAAISYVDSEIGRLLRGVEDLGPNRDTIVVVTSDHGELLGESGLVGHPAVSMEEVLAVPLLVALPGSSGRTNEMRRVAHHDVRAMVEAALEGALADRLVESIDSREPRVMSEIWTTTPVDAVPRLTRIAYDGPYKLVERVDGTTRLFDLTQPTLHDRERTGPEALKEIERMRAHLPPLIEPQKRAGRLPSPEQIEPLRALGYFGH